MINIIKKKKYNNTTQLWGIESAKGERQKYKLQLSYLYFNQPIGQVISTMSQF